MREAHPGTVNLPVAGLSAQVGRHLVEVRDPGRTQRVAFGEQAARDVDWDLAVTPRPALVNPLARAALRAQPEIVVMTQLGGGEAVVQLDKVEICRGDARGLVRLVGRQA